MAAASIRSLSMAESSVVVKDGQLCVVDEWELIDKVQSLGEQLLDRTGIHFAPPMADRLSPLRTLTLHRVPAGIEQDESERIWPQLVGSASFFVTSCARLTIC